MNIEKNYLRKGVSIIFYLFLLVGVVVGVTAGYTNVVQNEYIQSRMFDIFFSSLASSINHHMGIFFLIAVGNSLLFFLFHFLRIPTTLFVILGLFPLTLISIFHFYIHPAVGFQIAYVKVLVGGFVIQHFISIIIFLVSFILLWFIGLRRCIRGLWKKKIFKTSICFTLPLVAGIFFLLVNILGFWNWSNTKTSGLNLVLISIDTLRADHLGCYGYEKTTSPNIDSFAAEGVQFMKAISQSSWTLPAHASLLTGLYPSVHGAVDKKNSIPPAFDTLTEILNNSGYCTAAFTGGGFLDPAFGFKQGFNKYSQFEAMDSEEIWDFIDDTRDKPFFLFLHTYKVHNYYVPDELMEKIDHDYFEEYTDWDWERIRSFIENYCFKDLNKEAWKSIEYIKERYDLSISHIDEQFGSLVTGIKERGLFENTIIILLSDHGEEFGDHGRTHHGATLYQEQVHIPLLMSLPPHLGSRRVIEDVVELIDIYPTILDCLGLQIPSGIDGQSLVHLIEGEGTTDGLAFSEISYNVSERYSVCDSATKLIFSPRTEETSIPGNDKLEAFTITWGPAGKDTLTSIERNTLVNPFGEWYERMLHNKVTSLGREEIELDPLLRQRLEALGYIQ